MSQTEKPGPAGLAFVDLAEVAPAQLPLRQRLAAMPGRFVRSLAGRLLALTVAFVLLAEVLVFAPSLGAEYETLLRDRVGAAQIAALALEAAPDQSVADQLEKELLANAGVLVVALQRDGARVLQLAGPLPPDAADRLTPVDLRTLGGLAAILNAFRAWLGSEDRLLQVLAKPRLGSGEFIEALVSERSLKAELDAHARDALFASLSISAMTGALVYLSLLLAFVYPLRRLTKHIERFRARPEDGSLRLRASGRRDEIGRAETAFADMEEAVRQAMRQRERLAALGAAVAKIAHDLRSGLATAQLLTERLNASSDPAARQIAPRIERAIARAAAMAQATLKYGRAQEPQPEPQAIHVRERLDEAAGEALAPFPGVVWDNRVDPGLEAWADPDLSHRIFVNLMRNAAQAMTEQPAPLRPCTITAQARREGAMVCIRLTDCGPGLPAHIQARLFEPFHGSTSREGAGLGLAIALELARAQGGDLALEASGPGGAVFMISVPAAPAPA